MSPLLNELEVARGPSVDNPSCSRFCGFSHVVSRGAAVALLIEQVADPVLEPGQPGSVLVQDVGWSQLGAGTLSRPLSARSGSGCCHHDSVGHWCICVTVCPLRPWVLGAVGSPPLPSLVTFASIVEEEKQQEAALIRSREKPLALIQVDMWSPRNFYDNETWWWLSAAAVWCLSSKHHHQDRAARHEVLLLLWQLSVLRYLHQTFQWFLQYPCSTIKASSTCQAVYGGTFVVSLLLPPNINLFWVLAFLQPQMTAVGSVRVLKSATCFYKFGWCNFSNISLSLGWCLAKIIFHHRRWFQPNTPTVLTYCHVDRIKFATV